MVRDCRIELGNDDITSVNKGRPPQDEAALQHFSIQNCHTSPQLTVENGL
jgi:hypothetical protein